jgi:hypothetical protein
MRAAKRRDSGQWRASVAKHLWWTDHQVAVQSGGDRAGFVCARDRHELLSVRMKSVVGEIARLRPLKVSEAQIEPNLDAIGVANRSPR